MSTISCGGEKNRDGERARRQVGHEQAGQDMFGWGRLVFPQRIRGFPIGLRALRLK